MQRLILFIWFVSITIAFSGKCVVTDNNKFLEVSINNFDVTHFLKELNQLKTEDLGTDLCGVEIAIRFPYNLLLIGFTEQLRDSILKDGDIRLITIVGNVERDNVLTHACNKEKCEIEFITKYLQWVLDAHYFELSDELKKLTISNSAISGKCFTDEDKDEQCSGTKCGASFSFDDTQQKSVQQGCIDDKDDTIPPGVQIHTYLDKNFINANIRINFICKYNLCNHRTMLLQIRDIVERKYNLTEIFHVFGYQGESQENPSTSMKNETTTLTSMTVDNTTTPNNNAWQITSKVTMINMIFMITIFFA